ncbi:MAG: signal peptide peptidase SppA [Parvularculaceae bacterium]|nr:signal peptide peptidase SppA [Parvularculaceae bacterium]
MTEIISGSGRSRVSAWQFFKGLGKFVVGGALLLQAFLFIAVFALLLSILGSVSQEMKSSGGGSGPELEIEEGSGLYFNPAGLLAETSPEPDPFEEAIAEAFGGGSPGQVSVHELADVLAKAKDDERISTLILDLQGLIIPDIYLSKANLLADAIEDFRESGKRVVSIGDGYGQNQYLVASEADTILMHKDGFMFIPGYGRFRTYYSSMLEKLDVTKNVFRVGTYKSALEPVLRDDMSPEAREANEAFLAVLWDNYTARIDENRDLGEGATKFFATQFTEVLSAAQGDFGTAAADSGYVDQLVTRDEQREFLKELVGEDEDGDLNTVGLGTYAGTLEEAEDREDVGNIAVVTVEGAIVDGPQETGVASGNYVSKLLRKARNNDDVKAVVLRVDSPGGSAFASELIRNEVQALKEAGKPVVVSMSSLAASGGYWISAPADAIWAQETTVTGSIGIFAYVPTFEKLAERGGVFTDGVGTTPYTGINAAGIGPMPEPVKDIFQMSIESGYRQFLTIVSEGRDMPVEEVAPIAEGRVWVGQTAKEIKLVDAFGGLDDAIADAAERAGLEDWDIHGSEEELTPFEKFLQNIGAADASDETTANPSLMGYDREGFERTAIGQAARLIEQELKLQASFDDPRGIYARCLECSAY